MTHVIEMSRCSSLLALSTLGWLGLWGLGGLCWLRSFLLGLSLGCWLSRFGLVSRWAWGGLLWYGFGVGFLVGSLLLLKEFGEQLLVGDVGVPGGLPSVFLGSLVECLSSKPLVSDESLDLWCLIESSLCLVVFGISGLGDSSSHNAFPWVILLSEGEGSSDFVGSLWSESSWSLSVGETGDLSWTLLEDPEEEGGKIWSADASSD